MFIVPIITYGQPDFILIGSTLQWNRGA